MPVHRSLPEAKAADLLHYLQRSSVPVVYEHEKHRLALLDEQQNPALYFRLPISLPYPAPEIYTARVNYIILLIQSGNCAMGYFENGRNLDHKVFRSYMVRKKQGKSQIKYLKTKGKSRAGSRVRLGETMEFFENINERLQYYFEAHEIHRIAISCSKTLQPYLYSSKVHTPFDKHDARLLKIPRHVHTPIHEVLMDTNRFLLRGELMYAEEQQTFADELLVQAGISDDTYEEDTSGEDAVYDEEDDHTLEDDLWDDEDDEMEW